MKNKTFKRMLAVMMLVLSIFMLFPYFLMLITSVKTMGDIQSPSFTFIPREVVFSNYIEAMSRGDWPRYFGNSIYVTFITVLASLMLNSITGYAFARLRFKGRDVLFIIALIGLMVPRQVTMLPLFIVLKNFPLVGGNSILGQGGHGFINSYAGMILPYVAGSFGVFLFRQFYLNFPRSLDDAARIDGLGRVKTFIYIYAPLSKPIFATLAALKTTQTWTEFTWPLIITSKDHMKTVQLALTMFRNETEIQWNLLMAATTVITLPLIIVFLCAQKYFIQGIVTSGIKG